MSWSSGNTNCWKSFTFFEQKPLNLLITADVLSCVIQRCGRIDRKSPVRSGRAGPSLMCFCAICSTIVWPMTTPDNSTLSLQPESQINHLANVVVQVGRTRQEHPKSILGVRTNRLV